MNIDAKEFVLAGEDLLTKDIEKFSLGAHEEFDRKVWNGKLSYHNVNHIRSVITALDMIFEGYKRGLDPLDIKGNLEKWNEIYPDYKIKSADELHRHLKRTFLIHDNGNIMDRVSFSDIEVKPVFLDKYKSEGSEERSMRIAKDLIFFFAAKRPEAMSNVEKEVFIVQQLTNLTKPGVDLSSPFDVLVETIDQFGNSLYRSDDFVGGLLEEMNPDQMINDPKLFFNYPAKILKKLVPDEEKRHQLVEEVFGKPYPKSDNKYPAEGAVSVNAALQFHYQ